MGDKKFKIGDKLYFFKPIATIEQSNSSGLSEYALLNLSFFEIGEGRYAGESIQAMDRSRISIGARTSTIEIPNPLIFREERVAKDCLKKHNKINVAHILTFISNMAVKVEAMESKLREVKEKL